MPKKQIILLAVLLAVLIQGGVIYRFYYKKNISGRGIACTQEAKLCPDGSYVGRTGPNCEFAACPEVKKDETADWQTYKNDKYGFELKYPKNLIESQDNFYAEEVYNLSKNDRISGVDDAPEFGIFNFNLMSLSDADKKLLNQQGYYEGKNKKIFVKLGDNLFIKTREIDMLGCNFYITKGSAVTTFSTIKNCESTKDLEIILSTFKFIK